MLRRVARVISLAWITATCSNLLLAFVAASSFAARFQNAFSYTTPLNANDFWYIVSRFRFSDLAFDPLSVYIAIALATAIVIFAAPHRTNLLLVLALPQCIFIPIVPGELAALLSDYRLFFGATLDGEFFHEGWPIMESIALWTIVPATIVLRRGVTLTASVWRRRPRRRVLTTSARRS